MATLSHLMKLLAQLPNQYKSIVVQNSVLNIYGESFLLRRALSGFPDGVYHISTVRNGQGVAVDLTLTPAKSPYSLFSAGVSMDKQHYPNVELCKPDISKARKIGSLTSKDCIDLSQMLRKSGPEVRDRMRPPTLGICPAGFVVEDHLIFNSRFDMKSIEYFSVGNDLENLFIELALYEKISIIQCPNHYNEYRLMPIMLGTGWENCVILHVKRDACFDLNQGLKEIESDEIPF